MKRRDRVAYALNAQKPDRPPKGELVITEKFVKGATVQSLESLLEMVNADLVTLELQNGKDINWAGWKRQDYYTFGLWQGPFSAMCTIMGWHTVADWLVHQPCLAGKWMRNYIHKDLAMVDRALLRGCDSILIADDLAGKTGLLISPSFLEEHYFSLFSEVFAQRYSGIPLLFHSDGYIADVIPLIWQAGFRGIQGLQPSSGMSVAAFPRSSLANHVFWGNFEYEGELQMKNQVEIKEDVIKVLNDWQDIPGYIFGSSGGLYEGINLEDVQTAYNSVDYHYRRE